MIIRVDSAIFVEVDDDARADEFCRTANRRLRNLVDYGHEGATVVDVALVDWRVARFDEFNPSDPPRCKVDAYCVLPHGHDGQHSQFGDPKKGSGRFGY